jgi:hypothetical protein
MKTIEFSSGVAGNLNVNVQVLDDNKKKIHILMSFYKPKTKVEDSI